MVKSHIYNLVTVAGTLNINFNCILPSSLECVIFLIKYINGEAISELLLPKENKLWPPLVFTYFIFNLQFV